MQNWNFKTVFRLMAIVGVMAGMLTIFACASDEEPLPEPIPVIVPPPKVASANTTLPVTTATAATTGQILQNQTFSFPNGAAALAALDPALATRPVTLTFAGTSSVGSALPDFTLSSGGGTARGTTAPGSCIFTVTSSNIPGVNVGETLTVNPCQVNAATGGVQATGNATQVQILLQLGLTPSAANQASVAIDPNTGIVTVNNVSTGVSVTLVVSTGTSGG